MTAEEREIVLALVMEARDLFDDAEPKLIALQQSANDRNASELINAVFRSFHSVKGAAATMGFDKVAGLFHSAENLMVVFRKGVAQLDAESLGLLLQAVDLARQLLARIEADQSDRDLENQVAKLREQLEQALVAAEKQAKSPHSSESKQATISPPAEKSAAPPSTNSFSSPPAAAASLATPLTVAQSSATPLVAVGACDAASLCPTDFTRQFTQESEELLSRAEAGLLTLESSPSDAQAALADAFRAVHSFKGNCGFMGQVALEHLAHRVESLLDSLREAPAARSNHAVIAALLKGVDGLRGGVTELTRQGQCSGAGFSELEAALDEATTAVRQLATTAVQVATETAVKSSAPLPQRQDIRVDLEKLDTLVNLVGELVIAEAMVTDHPMIAGAEDETLARAIHLLRRVSFDLQDVAMSVRMVPLSGAFRKLVRLVHDVSHKVNKKVRLKLVGEETEVDKSVLEQLSDPLVHLVRNSIDHGLEPPEERLRLGKSEEGTITVEARHEGGEVLVVVNDDGRGLNRQRVLQKGIERGLVRAEEAEKIPDEQAFALIFEPGFSTAEKVTDVSGRGVGMDVVRKNIERLQGAVELRSRPGAGSSVILHIPLTLAIIDGMLVRVGGARYTVPLLSIRESVRPDPDQITTTPDGQEVARIRDRLIPVVRLHDIFHRTPEHRELHKGILLVVEANKYVAGLFADEILGQQQAVIKGLSSYLGRARGVSGCTILGNGEVSLILDVVALLGMAQSRAAA